MAPPIRSKILALCAIALLGSSSGCTASPVSSFNGNGAILPRLNSTYSLSPLSVNAVRGLPIPSISNYSTPAIPDRPNSRAIPRKHALRQLSQSQLLELDRSYQRARERAGVLQQLNGQAVEADPNDEAFQKRYTAAAEKYTTTILDLKTVLEKLAADKGLAFFDPADPLEVLLKNVVNLHKDTLSELVTTVQNVPFLGPALAPIIYQLKCIIDDILNITENLSDATLNLLRPIIDPLLGSSL